MAVKPITNRQAVTKEQVNRAEQRSFRNYKNRSTNRAQAVIPGKDFTKNYAVTLKDVDTSVINHIKHVISPAIREAGETVKVPVLYGNQERWIAARKSGAMRDKNGSITAVEGSGMRSMSLSLMSFHILILDPSNPRPSLNTPASISDTGKEVCCQVPNKSQNLKSTISIFLDLISFSTSLTL